MNAKAAKKDGSMLVKPRILTVDIETAPITAYTWGLFKQNIGLNQIKKDWHLLAWAAKWYNDPPSKVMYMDNRDAKNIGDDKRLVKELAKLLEEADIVITQNGEKFDMKKLNARAVINGLPPIKPCLSTDILKEGRKVFSFTSHKLEYVANKLNKKYKKLKHAKYPGFELWRAIMAGDKAAWKEMETYTKHDVLSTEEAYTTIRGWIKTQNLASFANDLKLRCRCGSTNLKEYEVRYLASGHYQGYRCRDCGKRLQGKTNLLSIDKKRSLLKEWR